MANSQRFRNILNYYKRYWGLSVFSITAGSLFEVLDLAVPYAIGQLLNTLSGQPLDGPLQRFVARVGAMGNWEAGRSLSLMVLLGLIFLVTVVRAPIQAWLGVWFHWDIALKSRRDHTIRAIAKVLSLPLEFYDENNPGRTSGRVARGLANHTWTYPEVAGQLIPKIVRVIGIFGVILLIEWRIAILFLISFVLILAFLLHNLRRLIKKEERLDEYMENTESRTSEIITNIKTVRLRRSQGVSAIAIRDSTSGNTSSG